MRPLLCLLITICPVFVMFANYIDDKQMKVILISGKAQHGKDTTANILKDYFESKNKKVLITHYGDLVKYICKTLFNWNGEKDKAGRELLQRVGTDNIRKVYPEFWVRHIYELLTVFNGEWDYVIIPDCRFPNEIEIFSEGGFNTITIRVNRINFKSPLTIEQQHHSSETSLDHYIFDYKIDSESGVENLKTEVMKIVGYL